MEHLNEEKIKFLTNYFKDQIARLQDDIDLNEVIKSKDLEKNNSDDTPTDYFLQSINAIKDEYEEVVYKGIESGYPSIDSYNERDLYK